MNRKWPLGSPTSSEIGQFAARQFCDCYNKSKLCFIVNYPICAEFCLTAGNLFLLRSKSQSGCKVRYDVINVRYKMCPKIALGWLKPFTTRYAFFERQGTSCNVYSSTDRRNTDLSSQPSKTELCGSRFCHWAQREQLKVLFGHAR